MDVIHSWWVPALTGKMDAIPGRINSLRFVPETTGDFEGKCAELCGVQHAFMPTTVTVLEPGRVRVDARRRRRSRSRSGKATWEGVCATCHGLDGQGDVGPADRGQRNADEPRRRSTTSCTTGQDTPQFDYYMPPVGARLAARAVRTR